MAKYVEIGGDIELAVIGTDEISFFDFLSTWHYPSDDHTRGYSTKGTYDIYWSRVQNITHTASVSRGYVYPATFVFSSLIEFYSSKIFDTKLDSGVKCVDAINDIGFYRRTVYNEKLEEKNVTERERNMVEMVFDQFSIDIGKNITSNKKYIPRTCKINAKVDMLYGNMSSIGMKMVDLTNLIIMLATIENDKYLSTENSTRYMIIMRSFFTSVEKLHKTVLEELN